MATLFVLSAIPNPAFEVAGLTAGSVRMPFRRFFLYLNLFVLSMTLIATIIRSYYRRKRVW